MSHTPHELAAEFPQHRNLIHRLKQDDAHFARLTEQYHVVNRNIHRIESEIEPASDERAELLKKQRLTLTDQIAAILAKAQTAT